MKKKDQVVSFRIGKERFGVPIESVQEIVRVPEITVVPEMPSFVDGVINLRGKIISIIDLGKRLKMDGATRAKSNRILVVEVENKVVGLLVDGVYSILKIPPEAVEPAPDIVSVVGAEYILGVGKLPETLIILLSLKNILRADEISKLAAEERKEASPGENAANAIDHAA